MNTHGALQSRDVNDRSSRHPLVDKALCGSKVQKKVLEVGPVH
jgi:hypothetical protein